MQNESTKNLYLQKRKVMLGLFLGFVLTLITWKIWMYGLVFCIADTMQWCIVVDVSIYKTNDEHNNTANAYRQTTDKLMFKSVISTVRWIRK